MTGRSKDGRRRVGRGSARAQAEWGAVTTESVLFEMILPLVFFLPFSLLSVRVSSDCAPLCRSLSSGWCRPQPSRRSCLAHAPPSGSPGEQKQRAHWWSITTRCSMMKADLLCSYSKLTSILYILLMRRQRECQTDALIYFLWTNISLHHCVTLFLYSHSPGLCPIMWFECVSSHFHLSGPRLLDCTAFPSSQTLAAYPRGGLPACAGTTGTDCHRSRVRWEGGPAWPLAQSSCCLPQEWWGTVHLESDRHYSQ